MFEILNVVANSVFVFWYCPNDTFIHRWLKRDGGGNEIESFLKKAPFENYPLFLGAMKLKTGIRMFRQMQRRKVRVASEAAKRAKMYS